jgi:hypothetical protein
MASGELKSTIPRSTILLIAALSQSDPRSVTKEIGEPGSVRGDAGRRIRATLADAPALLDGAPRQESQQ